MCMDPGTTCERDAVEHAAANGYAPDAVPFEATEASRAAFHSGRCNAFMDRDLQPAVMRATEVDDPECIVILPFALPDVLVGARSGG